MGKHILLIQGHPDVSQRHLCHALEDAYVQGATAVGHEIQRINVATLDFPLLRSQLEWEQGELPPGLANAQAAIKWAEHLVLFFPLWLGDMPALLKGFLEQVARPGFAFSREGKNPLAAKGLTGRSARVVVTMGMPATVYRWYFRAHSIKSLERNILGFVGIAPVHETLVGMVGNMEPELAKKWLTKLEKLGERGD
ncbi:MAG: NAD(P)H-dependent oxidoreductase [Rhodoferax sp.]|uniref:NAD(P)H-dependent oxidoreductase n=1 Tax=Rhodoferax sp. TaxID=50421 RepID=UPI0027304FFF|nr:NAD(P)H-dependent oxidoreductase [Rhodoferax sp.]MDP1529225.1 NAD(P)H-dependent oxidoreductase [Rhodoferax sp.]